jgi:A/G-specific adenine glycosylase
VSDFPAHVSGMDPGLFHAPLLTWFRRHKRDLPWRRNSDPYRVWVSEVMLQQTTVRVVTPYFERFVETFPSVEALAQATEDEVLASWSGLGYYRRARNLHRGAQHIVSAHGGRFPTSLDAALSIPGVGLYTASAVLSISASSPLPVVDGNVKRVLARLVAVGWTRDAPYLSLAHALLFHPSPGMWNEALMELGAIVCTPKKPACDMCPLSSYCRALATRTVERFPKPKARRAVEAFTVRAALLERGGAFLVVRREEGTLLGRLWELPQTPLEVRPVSLATALRKRYGLAVRTGELAIVASHAITFRRIRLEGYRSTLLHPPPLDPKRMRFSTLEELSSLPLSSMTRKLIVGLTKRPQARKL